MESPSETPTLRALLSRPALRLRLVETAQVPTEALDREVRWVHSTDLADPTPFLSEGLVLLTTGTQFEGRPDAQYAEYVERLAGRGVVGLGFGTEVVREGVPQTLADACVAAGMPLFEVPYETPFIAVARANAEAIAAQAYSRRSWALAAQRAIALAALRPDGFGATVAELAKQLDAWVGMFDAAGELMREHPIGGLDAATAAALHDEVDGVLRRGARAGSSLRLGETPFSLQTLGRGGHLRGVIAIGAGDLDQEGRGVVTSVIAMAGLALEQQQGLSRARTSLRTGLVHSLASGDPALARRISRDLWGPLPAAPVVVALTDAAAARVDGILELLELRADERRGAVFFGRIDDGLVIVGSAGDLAAVEEVVDRFAVRAGLSDPAAYESFADALGQARTARDRGTAAITAFAEVARSGVLSALSDEARTLARAELAPLVEHDAAQGARLVETLRSWLDHDCSHEATATALGVHRHTVRTRLAAVDRVLGRDLASFATRAELWAALRALDAPSR
ncbi:purine catabolism regulator [Microbacterium terrae]|uniref:Carbohydrate diacid transcriptional activator CdaR n=1 Tax=Microbacterium terrae TaxID=69369 RepID=A0A0M2H238_9MICO|nr:PucR family transcriptional regulator [Microbacterium terrae]KJL37633.1 carbohydrate diacid transcriptional activator CdaR [Microbacterium terrae]MBP1076465.1 purine catabolism regulator [Microbacterium terrae]GLJ97294.1 PucR family transcriptional regulator [Microbacterium terrae]